MNKDDIKFVLATANPGKLKEMRSILKDFKYEVLTRKDCGIEFEVEETGTTFLENAMLKAKAICEATGLPAIADDSGLVVRGLNDLPGVYSSSFGGAKLSDKERCSFLLSQMSGITDRAAAFVCTIAALFPDGSTIISEGRCCGEIAFAPRGENGFGYDPVFIVEGTEKTMAELLPSEKDLVSHRGKALSNFILQMSENSASGILAEIASPDEDKSAATRTQERGKG